MQMTKQYANEHPEVLPSIDQTGLITKVNLLEKMLVLCEG